MAKKDQEKPLIPKIPERIPHRKIEQPTEPNRQIPEIEPQRENEEQNFPGHDTPEQNPQKPREAFTGLNL